MQPFDAIKVYYNNRTNSYVKDSTLFIQPSLTSDILGEAALSSERLDLWGAQVLFGIYDVTHEILHNHDISAF